MKNKLTFWLITSILSIIFIYILVVAVVMPVMTKNVFPKAVINKPLTKEKSGKGKVDSSNQKKEAVSDSLLAKSSKDGLKDLLDIRKKENWLQSRLELASEDSMYLVLDLAHNVAIIEMKGIVLHECKIIKSEISNSIKTFQNDILLNWMAQPFSVKRIDATIPKISFIEKIAPKDTIEANKTIAEPKMPELEDVYIVMDFDRNLRLVIQQSEKPEEKGEKVIKALRWKYQLSEIRRTVQSLTKFNRQPSMPQISIILPKSDATILYKSLPVNLKMILKL
jgi:hypothetical protein